MVSVNCRFVSRVAVGVSGGVDSSVAAWILKRKGYDVQGVFMHNWDQQEESGVCSSAADAETAAWVCKKLGIPFIELNFVSSYWTDVFQYLVSEYSRGRTPNPDLLCNQHIKFGQLLEACQTKLGPDCKLATGHYARLLHCSGGGVRLLQAVDQTKDQSYFLSQVSQRALRRAIFPLGGIHKSKVREMAEAAGLTRVAGKKDSTGICFIGKRNFQEFLSEYISDRPGRFLDVDTGEVVDQHRGQHLYTVGQRCKLPAATVTAYYVAAKIAFTPDVLVCGGPHHPSLYSNTVHTESPYWISGRPPQELVNGGAFECEMRFRHLQPLIKCIVTEQNFAASATTGVTGNADATAGVTENADATAGVNQIPDASSGVNQISGAADRDAGGIVSTAETMSGLTFTLEQPRRAITSGQFAVLYRGTECLGSAIISGTGPSLFSTNFRGCRDSIISIRSRLPTLDCTELAASTKKRRATLQDPLQDKRLMRLVKQRYCDLTGHRPVHGNAGSVSPIDDGTSKLVDNAPGTENIKVMNITGDSFWNGYSGGIRTIGGCPDISISLKKKNIDS